MESNSDIHPWWLDVTIADTATAAQGLSATEAARRLAEHGPNVLRKQREWSWLREYLRRFANPLVLILLAASGVSAFTGQVTDFVIIGAIVLLSVTLDYVQEHRANAAAEKLRLSVSLRTRVLRDGQPRDLPARDIVPGDVVLLSAGDLIPADARLIEADDFFVKQALLTGESYPVEKHPGQLPAAATEMQAASNAVFMGTSVISGSARAVVVKTGTDTAMGGIADSLARPAAPTSFERGVHDFGLLIMRLTMLMVMFVLLVNAFFHRPWLESFLFAIALAVGLTPELLPMVISVTLARGALRMAKHQTIVKRLSAIQDLGSMDVLCTDKTGTLTEAKIQLERHVDLDGKSSEHVNELAYLNSFFETGLKSPLDDAILEHGHVDVGAWQKIDEVPFDFERRRVSVLLDNGASRWLVVKGAPDDIVGLCASYESGDGGHRHAMEASKLATIQDRYRALEAEGFRVLGIAWREVPRDHPHAVVGDESDLVLAGFAGFLDPPKPSAAHALAALERSGVAIKIVTGDSDLVTKHICAQLDIPVRGVLTGSDIAALDDRALQARVESANLFCRVNPSQKERVIRAFKQRGHVVGYLGDGINDAPSLHTADVGLSVEGAVDVAKEAADMILMQPNLQVLHAGVIEGRRTFGNIMKYILMGTSSNFGNMFSMAGAALFLPFLPMLPTQILLNNLLYDISEIPIPLDRVDAIETRNPRALNIAFIRNFMITVGLVSSLFDFMTFYLLLRVLKADESMFHTGWFVESLCTQVLVIFVIRTRHSPFKSRPHPALLATSLAAAGIAIMLPYIPAASRLGFVPLPLWFFLMLGALTVSYLALVEFAKRYFYRHGSRHARGAAA